MEWKTIDSAPRDGTKILVCYIKSPSLGVKLVSWQKSVFGDPTDFRFYEGKASDGYDHFPTHWMPLPPPPEAE